MQEIFVAFAEGGWGMFLVLPLGAAGLIAGLLHVLVARGLTLGLAAVALALVLASGFGVTLYDRSRVDAAAAEVPELDRDMVLLEGYREASRPVELAGIFWMPGFALFILGEVRRRRRVAELQLRETESGAAS